MTTLHNESSLVHRIDIWLIMLPCIILPCWLQKNKNKSTPKKAMGKSRVGHCSPPPYSAHCPADSQEVAMCNTAEMNF